MLPDEARSILDYWFVDISDASTAAEVQAAIPRWFQGSEDADAELTELFGGLLTQAAAGELESWMETPQGTLALIILVDQFSRNIHRGSAQMYAADGLALRLTISLLERGIEELQVVERMFALMPLQHVEAPALQERSVVEFSQLAEAAPPHLAGLFKGFESYAERHRDVVVRFGRFPHRNDILGRESTEEELAFLADTPGGF